MNKIKFLTGRYVYITLPPKPKSKVIVDENTREALQAAMLKNLKVTTIYAMGPAANPELTVGDKVLVNPASLVNPSAVKIDLVDEDGKDFIVCLIQDFDIIHVWDE